MAVCIECGGILPLQTGPGRRRQRCEECRPGRAGQRLEPRLSASLSDLLPDEATKRVPEPDDVGPILAVTRGALAEANTGDTPAAILAQHFANLLDAGGYTAQGAASLGKALRETLAEALRARPTTDALDELVKRRRDRQRDAG